MGDQQEDKKVLKDKIHDIEYIRGKLLGTGGFAKCFQVINQQNQQIYAAKVIPKKSIHEKRQRYKLLVQIKIHRALKHRHIVQFIGTFEDRENVYIVLEYCRNYTLKDLVKRRKRVSEYETRIYIEQVVKALIYIHSESIIHRDLKLGNILINDQMDTKICDFGLSTKVKHEGEVKKTICGTPNYIAPEILQENGHSYEVDIWSTGVIMYTLLFGKPPFEDTTVQQTYQNIKTNKFNYPTSIPVSPLAKDLINKILVTNPAKRISLEGILQHQFMRHRMETPQELPAYTLAIPPFKFMEIESRHLNSLQEQNYEISSEIERNAQQSDNSLTKQGLLFKQKSNECAPSLFIRECFCHEDNIGYLLSNGVIGVFYRSNGTNIILEFGSQNYYIVTKDNESRPTKHSLPYNDYEVEHAKMNKHVEILLNFKAYFVSQLGIFKLDELCKTYNAAVRSKQFIEPMEELFYIKKAVVLAKGEILTRLSNSIIQVHFNDLTSLVLNRQQEQGDIYYLDRKSKINKIQYEKCKDSRIKTKIRMFSNIIQKLSSNR